MTERNPQRFHFRVLHGPGRLAESASEVWMGLGVIQLGRSGIGSGNPGHKISERIVEGGKIMNGQANIKGLKAQRGVVLFVALILLVIITLAGLAAMQGATLQERMTIAQVQMHGAFLGSEQQVWDAAACIRALYVDADGKIVDELPEPRGLDGVEGACGPPYDAVVEWDDDLFLYNIRSTHILGATGAMTPVAMQVLTPGGLSGAEYPDPLPRLAPYVCFGENCEFNPSAGAAASSADGTNREAVSDTSCGALGTNRPSIFDGNSVPGVIIPHGTLTSDEYTYADAPEMRTRGQSGIEAEKSGKTADIIGTPPVVNSENWEDSAASDIVGGDYKSFIDRQIDPIVDAFPSLDVAFGTKTKVLESGWHETPLVVAEGETITLGSGANAMAGGIIVLDGGTLELNGNQCFNGVVLFRNGGGVVAASGTPAVLGSVMGYAPPPVPEDSDEENVIINPRLGGVPSFYYSGLTIGIVDDLLRDAFVRGVVFELVRWRTPRGL